VYNNKGWMCKGKSKWQRHEWASRKRTMMIMTRRWTSSQDNRKEEKGQSQGKTEGKNLSWTTCPFLLLSLPEASISCFMTNSEDKTWLVLYLFLFLFPKQVSRRRTRQLFLSVFSKRSEQ